MQTKVLGVIPARLGSTRLKRKMLLSIGGKPLIYYTWRQAMKAKSLDTVIVATESKEIAAAVREFGGIAVLTSAKHETGSDRVAEAAKKFKGFKPSIVVNLQGDEPTVPPEAIDQLVAAMRKRKDAVMGTIATSLSDPKKLKDPDVVKTVIDQKGNAIYFSRYPIPYPRSDYKEYHSKLGLYAFTYEFLQTYVRLPRTPLEKAESLEQLRAIEHGYKVIAPIGNYDRVEVNNARQFAHARRVILGTR